VEEPQDLDRRDYRLQFYPEITGTFDIQRVCTQAFGLLFLSL